MAVQFNVSAAYDKEGYTQGDTIRASISGGAVVTTTQQTTAKVGPLQIPLVDESGDQSVISVPEVGVTVTSEAQTDEAVTIDTSRPVVDSGPNPRSWVVSADKLSITATA